MNKNLAKAVQIIKNGGIIIFPTDTAFGIGCRIDDESAVQRLFDIRKRSEKKAAPVLFSSIRMVREYVDNIDPEVRKVMGKHWPGGLTLILHCMKNKVPSLVRGGGETIGIRIPAHRGVRKLIKEVGVPILGPSANFSGEKTPFKISQLDPKLVAMVDFVLPGRCKIKKPSTVLDVSKKPWRVIREGAVKVETR